MVLERYRSGWEATLSPVARRFHAFFELCELGPEVGLSVGLRVGVRLGLEVGLRVGVRLGVKVGLSVGEGARLSVGGLA